MRLVCVCRIACVCLCICVFAMYIRFGVMFVFLFCCLSKRVVCVHSACCCLFCVCYECIRVGFCFLTFCVYVHIDICVSYAYVCVGCVRV